jgi:putative cardiolipin synthase
MRFDPIYLSDIFTLLMKVRTSAQQASSYAAFATLLLLCSLVIGCATLPTDYEKLPSAAIRDTSETFLGQRSMTQIASQPPGYSGFYFLNDGVEALGARLILARAAESSIDVQYYYVLPDITGYLLFRELIEAANRGVRVRILLDDIETKGYEDLFAVLSTNPNIEIRLSNPFANRSARGLNALSDFQRINHRMHNKSITFDNTVTIVGGRNIGAEYFDASSEFNYGDLDVLAVGPVADLVSTEFDIYWNANSSVPVTAFVEPDESAAKKEKLLGRVEAAVVEAKSTPYAAALQMTLGDLLFSKDSSELHWAPAQVVFDRPYGEVAVDGVEATEVLAGILADAIADTQTELFVVSPYFVPGDSGVAGFRKLRERGVRCVVITNSLASTDVAAVYGGYKKYQKALLEIDVELWEVMAFPEKPGNRRGTSTERRSLHAKTFVADRKLLFVGSFNWDPRSAGINSEMGVLIDSEQLGLTLVEGVESVLSGSAWQLRLSEKGKVEWIGREDGKQVIYSKPPQSSIWRRMEAWFTALDAIEGQL